jgi:hypothetical protein
MYRMTPIDNNTRIRSDHNVYAGVIQTVAANIIVSGDQLWEAPADGNEVKKGDRWLFITRVNGLEIVKPGWMAQIHKGVPICKDFTKTVESISHVVEVLIDGELVFRKELS